MRAMEHFNVRAELATRRQDLDDDLIDALEGYSPAVSRSDRGRVEVIITLPADTLRQAITTALPLLEQAGDVPVIALEVMSTAEFDARNGIDPIPDLVSVSDAAELLGVTRTRGAAAARRGQAPRIPGRPDLRDPPRRSAQTVDAPGHRRAHQ